MILWGLKNPGKKNPRMLETMFPWPGKVFSDLCPGLNLL
jgi:hypothetical protein